MLFEIQGGIVLLELLLEELLLGPLYSLPLLPLHLLGGVGENHKNISLMYQVSVSLNMFFETMLYLTIILTFALLSLQPRRIRRFIWGSSRGSP